MWRSRPSGRNTFKCAWVNVGVWCPGDNQDCESLRVLYRHAGAVPLTTRSWSEAHCDESGRDQGDGDADDRPTASASTAPMPATRVQNSIFTSRTSAAT